MLQLKNKTESAQTGETPQNLSLFAELKTMLASPDAGKLRRRLLLLLATFAVLIILIVVGTFAWYTRISNITGLSMEAAEFDFNANYVNENFIIRVQNYLGVDGVDGEPGRQYAAPGTGGVIPIRVSAASSDVDVDYTLKLNLDKMAPEFLQRIRYYYYTTDGKVHNINVGEETKISSTLPAKETLYEYIYWEWVYELPTKEGDWYYDNGSWKQAGSYPNFSQEQRDAFNEFDTKLGMGEFDEEMPNTVTPGEPYKAMKTEDENGNEIQSLKAYQVAMEVTLNVTGVQAEPKYVDEMPDVNTPAVGMTVQKPGTASTSED